MSHCDGGEENFVSFPRGGPVYVSDMIGPLSRVSDFESSVFQELQSLQEELSVDYVDMIDENFCVDELKIIGEEDLVAQAFEEAFKERFDLAVDTSPVTNTCSSPRKRQNNTFSTRRKRKLEIKKDSCLNESYMSKVAELSRIKQKQEEDKKAVRLHSFNGSSKVSGCGTAPKSDMIKFFRSATVSKKIKASSICDHVPVNYPEAILCVEIFHSRKSWSKTQEFLILGRQLLTELKDQISCVTDEMMKKQGVHDPSGYFLIEDCFCNDTRSHGATDYSKPILDWLENSKTEALEKWDYITSGELQPKQKAFFGVNKKVQLPRFRSAQMQTTRFCDLKFKLGAGYLYCHQGDCKHVIVFRDMRLVHPEDVQNRAAYPLMTFRSKLRHRKCCICKIYMAQKVTVDDKWAASNPSYFCDVCYYMLHYGNEGSLLYNDFSVYACHKE